MMTSNEEAHVRASSYFLTGYDSNLKNLKVEKVEEGKVTCSLVVDSTVCNSYGTLHGGASATLVDIAGTISLLTLNPQKV